MNNAATPLLKFGVLTDNHLSPALPQNIRRTEQVFQLFQQHHVDAVVNCGDITDRYDPEMIAKHNRIFDQVFANGGKGAVELAKKVVAACDKPSNFSPIYGETAPKGAIVRSKKHETS